MSGAGQLFSRSRSASRIDAENPWPGLEEFYERDRQFFFGREEDARELRRLVLRERLTVLYGKSGLGKSSLLRAGLFPRVRADGLLPVYIRLALSEKRLDLRMQVRAMIAFEAAASGVDSPKMEPDESLWEYFHRQGADFWSPQNRPLTPLLVFDQFEEVFTLGRSQAGFVRSILDDLADLIEDRPPEELKGRLDEDPEQTGLFTFVRNPYKLLICLREDFLADFEGLRDRAPSIAHSRMRLQRMNGEAALRVVTGASDLVSEDVARRIVRFVTVGTDDRLQVLDESTPYFHDRDLSALEVEPALLSVVCRELNERRRRKGAARITADLLRGTQEEILANLYEQSVEGLGAEVRSFIEEELLTPSGYRDSVALEAALAHAGVTSEAIDRLVDRRLLRLEERDALQRVELTHDLLTGVIAQSRDRRRQGEARAEAEEARLKAEERERMARLMLRRSRRTALLLLFLLALAIAGAVVGLVGQRRAERARAEADRARSEAEEALYVAEASRAVAETRKLEADVARAEAEVARAEAAGARSTAQEWREQQHSLREEILRSEREATELERKLEAAAASGERTSEVAELLHVARRERDRLAQESARQAEQVRELERELAALRQAAKARESELLAQLRERPPAPATRPPEEPAPAPRPAMSEFERKERAQKLYAEAIRAIDFGEWQRVADALREAIELAPRATGERVPIYGNRFEPYLPYLHLARAYQELGDCDQALAALDRSEAEASAAGRRPHRDARALRRKCEG